jgi:predicted nucleic acid-binding protein
MTCSSCITNEDSELVLDASVIINLLATGHSSSVLQALGVPIVVTDVVVQEIRKGSVVGRQEAVQLEQLICDQFLRVEKLEGPASESFRELVGGSVSDSLDDGEAATLAFAHNSGFTAAIDEKKATRIAAERFASLRLVTTVDILAYRPVQTRLGTQALAEAMFRALRFARMQVQERQFDWVSQLIGQDNVQACSTLRRHAKRKLAVRGPLM